MVRFAVIGTNFITERFLDGAKLCSDFQLSAIYSRTPERAKAFLESCKMSGLDTSETRLFDSLDALARCSDVDAVYIASPNSFHHPQAIQLLKSGKHVLCEKPIAANTVQLREMIAAAEESHCVLMEAMRPLHHPGMKWLKENMNRIGKIRRATFSFCQYSSRYDKFKDGIVENAFNPALANGALMDIGIYCISPMLWLFGKPQSLCAKAVRLENGLDGSGAILAEWADMQAELIYSKITDSACPSEIQGEKGSVLLHKMSLPQRMTIRYRPSEAGGESREESIAVGRASQDMIYELRDFVDAVQMKETERPGIWLENSLQTMEILDQTRAMLGIRWPFE